MTGRQKAFRLAMLVALALCAGAWFMFPPNAPAPATVPKAAAVLHGAASASTQRPEPESLSPSPPLPPAEAPLPLVYPSLQARADAGDAKAACRLGIELLRCQRLGWFQDYTREHLLYAEAEATKAGDLDLADELARANLHYREIGLACAELSPALMERGAHYLRQAALAGEPEAMLRYADGQGFRQSPWDHGYLRSPEFDQWRREAPGMIERALALGRPEAVHLLESAHTSDEGLLQGIVRNDPVQAAAHRQLIERLQGADGPRLPAGRNLPRLDTQQEQQAMALAADWHARHFDGGRVDAERALDGIASFHDPDRQQGRIRTDLAFCGSPTGVAHE